MTMHNRISFPLIGLLLIIAISCGKERILHPKVSIIQPSGLVSYQYGDTLMVELQVLDLDGALLVNLLDGENIVGPGFKLLENEADRYRFYAIFNDPGLDGGQYILRVMAYNGDNRTVDFTSIYYQPGPRMAEGFGLLLDNAGSTELAFLSGSGSFTTSALSGDYPYLAANSSLGYLITAPAYSGKLTAFDKFFNMIFELPGPSPAGALQYRELIYHEGLVYALDNEGYIRAYQSFQIPVRNYQLAMGRLPLKGAFNINGEFLVAAANPGFASYKVLLLNPLNGFVLKSEDLPHLPIGVASNAGDYFILCADAGSSVLYKYSPNSGILKEWVRLENESPVDVSGTAAKAYLATNKGLYGINGTMNTGQPFLPLTDKITSLPIGDLSGSFHEISVYFAAGENIYEFSGTSAQQVGSVTGRQIKKIEVLYNR